ncbi:hypothetical protein D9615_001456 [Tricholomella constricta]|uniref:Protein kinase domain-containing protein n=1 Tax=Tricholomella constricta TaxID=117010 RepID=A0A8H5HLF2_9AGAR|nr:hypothetical protein D9615_001456 [Tricholomella constricta]
MFTPNSRSRPTSKVLLTRIRNIHSLLPFGPSSAGTKTSIQGPSKQNTQPESSRSRDPKKSTRTTNDTGHIGQSNHKKATFQWVKGEPLGKGSYATVYLGLNATTGEIMAVKQVEIPQNISDKLSSRHQEIADALKFENQTLRGLDHPNIVQYLGYEESASFLEYVPGGTISSCLQNHGRFSDEVTRSFTRQMLEGLEYLHCMGILHRVIFIPFYTSSCLIKHTQDLKSDNILVEPSGVCKISDFGISKQAEDILQARAFTGMRGTIYWMAPEMLDSDKRKGYDVKVDIWSVGCIVLEMWTGERPWYGEEIFPVMMKLSQAKLPPPLPPDLVLTENASAFRRQCFQINPHDRPSAAELQAHPYLVLPKSWSFDVSEIEPTPMRRSFPQTSRRSRGKSMKSNRLFSSPSVNSEDVPPVPPITTIARRSPYRPVDRSSEPDSLRPSLPDHHQRPDSRPKPDSGPPVVYITPPSSPPSQITLLSNNNSRTSLDTSGSFSTTRKGFRIINPDPEPDTEAEPFVYNPPPLPNIDLASPYSARLSPQVVLGANEAYPAPHVPHIRASSPVSSASVNIGSSRRKPASHQASQRQTTVSETSDDYYPDTYNDDDDEIWTKPPADLTTKGASSRHRASRNHSASEAASRASTHEEWARPVHSEVYENLQGFFPEYDLDAVISVGSAGSPLVDREDRKQRIKKSIRMVAEEQNRLGSRRRTKLWDSKVEELRM